MLDSSRISYSSSSYCWKSHCRSAVRGIWKLCIAVVLCRFPSIHRGGVGAMRMVVQRVKSASVTILNDPKPVSCIGPGLVALVGLHVEDTVEDAQYCCQRLLNCKLWANAQSGGLWRHSVKQKQYECLLVSQFTLYGTLSKKTHQPDYKLAMKSVPAQELYEQLVQMVRSQYDPLKVQDGVFGAMMDVSLINDGPVTIIIDSRTSEDTVAIDRRNTMSDTDTTPSDATQTAPLESERPNEIPNSSIDHHLKDSAET